ncbi:hypothetical protein QIS74_03840 [Colletotrichum tabaci]|uniref:Uncharacterized protein n=1 Tax=Colletotrichum tabaci TaxID=1209068 RepID=A0AAV9TL49_9PEZI
MTRQRHLALHLAAALALLAAVLPGARVAAIEDLEAEDVPPECAAACTPIVQLTGRCEAQAEQRFGTDRRRSIGRRRVAVDGPEREARRRWRKRRSLQRTLGTRLGRRQREEEEDDDDVEDGDEDDDSDEEEGAAARTQPAPGRLAETEWSKAADEAGADAAMRACVCGERGFDVAGAAFGCAACVARNGTAVEANEDHRRVRLCRRAGSSGAGDDDDDDTGPRACNQHLAASGVGPGRAVYAQFIDIYINNDIAASTSAGGCTPVHVVYIDTSASAPGYPDPFGPRDAVSAGRGVFDAKCRIGHARHRIRDAHVRDAAVHRPAERRPGLPAGPGRRKPDESRREEGGRTR